MTRARGNHKSTAFLGQRHRLRSRTGISQLRLFPLGLLLSVGVAVVPMAAETAARSGGELVILHSSGRPKHFNHAIASGVATASIGAQIFASPLRYDDQWQPQPYLAKRWTVSADGLSVTLELVENAVFHDGAPITSKDVAFSVDTARRFHPFRSMFEPVTRVETPTPHTAVICLDRPHPAILLAMSPVLLPILPAHIYGDGQDIRHHPANVEPVGSGPFRFVGQDEEKVVLERFGDFFLPGRPRLDRLVYRFETDLDAVAVGLLRGDAHLTFMFTDIEILASLRRSDHLAVTSHGYEGLGALNWLAFNLRKKPLSDVRVRRAIAHAVDRRFITEFLLQDESRPARGPIDADSPFADTDLPEYEYDLGRAEALLDQAGYRRAEDGVRFQLTLDYIPSVPDQQLDVAAYIRRQLGRLGISVDVRDNRTIAAWAERVGNWDFDMTLDIVFNWGDPVIGVHRTYQSDNIRKGVIWSNTQGYSNADVDAILRRAATEMDPALRRQHYRDFQRRVVADLPVLWLDALTYYTIYQRELANVPTSIWGGLSPLDELNWCKPQSARPETSPPPPTVGAVPTLAQLGRRAVDVVRAYGAYEAMAILQDPAQGFLDPGPSGLHVLGVTRAGLVFLDNSGQLKRGMDISGIPDAEGRPIFTRLLAAGQSEDGGLVENITVWPHPRTGQCGRMTAWCVLSGDDVLCVMTWARLEEGAP